MASSNSNVLISQLLEKTSDFDKDERYMATSDLCTELQKEFKLDASIERRICSCIIKQLDDKSNDVQSIAVKCLGILVTKVQQPQLIDISDKLCELILDGKPELRDIYSIGLKTFISDVPHDVGCAVASRLINRLLVGIAREDSHDVQVECMDISANLLKRFGHSLTNDCENVMNTVMSQLLHQKHTVRKRASTCIGALGVVLRDALLNRLMEIILSQIQSPKSGQDVHILTQTIGTLSRSTGHRMGRYLERIIPVFLKYCGDPYDDSMQDDQANELREDCLHGFESLVLRCPKEITPFIPKILDIVVDFVAYDPNYNYGNLDDDDDPMEDNDEDFSDNDVGDYSDDDDTSWKARRAALKVLSSIITSRPEMLSDLYPRCSELLISRFKEREENVRLDVLSVFSDLLKASSVGDLKQGTRMLTSFSPQTLTQGPKINRQRSCISSLSSRMSAIIQASKSQLGVKKSVKSKCAVIAMLRQLVVVVPGELSNHLADLIPSVLNALEDSNSSLKLEALCLLRLLMQTHEPTSFHAHISSMMPLVISCAGEEWYKIIAEALRLIGVIALTIRPYNEELGIFVTKFDYQPFIRPLYDAVMPVLEKNDIDQEIKECAIASIGQILAVLGDNLTEELNRVLPMLMDRLQNEITRMSALRSLAVIAHSSLHIDVSSILVSLVTALSQFLRQQSRALKQATLGALNVLVVSNGSIMSEDLFAQILDESSCLISDSDLHLSQLSLQLAVSVLTVSPKSSNASKSHVLPKALLLAQSPLLQGAALESLLAFLKVLIIINASDCGFSVLLSSLLELVSGSPELVRLSLSNISRCVAVLCVNTTAGNRDETINKFINDIRGSKGISRQLALLCLGEIGSQMDLSSYANVQEVVLESFEVGGEETKSAAAFSFGRLAVGNMKVYIPAILSALEEEKNLYLLLTSLKEVITCHSSAIGLDFKQYVQVVLPILKRYCENAEEGVRNMVAECLGKLAIIEPITIVPFLAALCDPESPPLSRWTAVTSLKYCLTSREPIATLQPKIESFLNLLRDDDLGVRRAALLALNAITHHQPQLIQDRIATLVASVLSEIMDLKLERVVDLGPFKHKVDDGLVLRKGAFTCMDTILDTLPERVDIPSFCSYLKKGLDDHDDVQILCHQILSKLCTLHPGAVMNALESFIDPLEKTINRKVKDSQVGTEVERANELVRSALRAVVSVQSIPDVDVHRKFHEFVDRTSKKEKLASMLNLIKVEHMELSRAP